MTTLNPVSLHERLRPFHLTPEQRLEIIKEHRKALFMRDYDRLKVQGNLHRSTNHNQ